MNPKHWLTPNEFPSAPPDAELGTVLLNLVKNISPGNCCSGHLCQRSGWQSCGSSMYCSLPQPATEGSEEIILLQLLCFVNWSWVGKWFSEAPRQILLHDLLLPRPRVLESSQWHELERRTCVIICYNVRQMVLLMLQCLTNIIVNV